MAGDTRKHLTTLDGLRGIAALVIVLSHLGEALHCEPCVAHAHLAVEYFFLLSGFVFAYAYDARWEGVTVWGFFKRRLARLHPLVPLAVLLGIVPLLMISSRVPGGSPWTCALMAVGCMLMIPAFPSLLCNPFNGPVWTLYYEYLANVLYALVLRRLGKKALMVLAAVAAAATVAVLLRFDPFGNLPTYGYTTKAGWRCTGDHFAVAFIRLLFPLCAGLLICRQRWTIPLKNAFWPLAIVFAALLMMPVIPGSTPDRYCGGLWNGIYEIVVTLVAWPTLLMAGAGDEMDETSRTARFANWIGAISFPLYMTHYPLRMVLGWMLKGRVETLTALDRTGIVLAFFAVALAFAWAVKRFYYDPACRVCARWASNASQKERP